MLFTTLLFLVCSPNYQDEGFENGFVVCTDTVNPGSVCTFTCLPDYQIVGMNELICDETAQRVAQWSEEPPTCQGALLLYSRLLVKTGKNYRGLFLIEINCATYFKILFCL